MDVQRAGLKLAFQDAIRCLQAVVFCATRLKSGGEILPPWIAGAEEAPARLKAMRLRLRAIHEPSTLSFAGNIADRLERAYALTRQTDGLEYDRAITALARTLNDVTTELTPLWNR
jgi:hypothetical protein